MLGGESVSNDCYDVCPDWEPPSPNGTFPLVCFQGGLDEWVVCGPLGLGEVCGCVVKDQGRAYVISSGVGSSCLAKVHEEVCKE